MQTLDDGAGTVAQRRNVLDRIRASLPEGSEWGSWGWSALARVGVFVACLSLALGWTLARAPRPAPAWASVRTWVSDRDGDALIGLDRQLLFVRSVSLRAPIEVEARADGGAWVVSAPQGDPAGPHRLTRVSAGGIALARDGLGPLLDLSIDDLGRALVVEFNPSGAKVSVFDDSATAVWSRAWPGALCAASRGGELLVGTAQGELVLFDLGAPGVPPLRLAFGGTIGDVAPGPTGRTWWVLDASAGSRLALLDSALGLTWSRAVGLHALHLVPQSGEERVWIADATQPHVRRFGPGGVLELDRPDMLLSGLDRGCTLGDRSALFAAPGALLRLDAQGNNAPGQAGFDFLVDVAVVP